MSFILQPWQLLLVILAGWMSRRQQEVIEYLRTENQVLKEKLGKKRIRQVIVDLILRFAQENPHLGLRSEIPRGRWPTWVTTSPIPPSAACSSSTALNRAAGSPTEDFVGDVSQIPLGCAGRDRLHDRGSLDERWLSHALPAVRHACRHTPCPLRRLHDQFPHPLDEISGSRTDQFRGRVPQRETLFDHGPRR